MSKTLTIDFYHDVVCGWCFNISPRLRQLAGKFSLNVQHRAFVLQRNREDMVTAWGSLPRAKKIILGHWEACRNASDTPELFNIEGMRRATFEYPFGLPAALACKAAERIGGQHAHWQIFDLLQSAHLTQTRNIADANIVLEVAEATGFDRHEFNQVMSDPETRLAVDADLLMSRRFQVKSVPTLIVRETGARLVNGPVEDLRAQLVAAHRLNA
ncbi:DsbA family oxidoreductase [Roseibium sp. SCP14]|uniref:DsbA family oxidoreductase n=1 Tax=Roseibium sp. SCP14 TaxID=3141375 RepID=UPI00333C01E6